MIEDASSNTYSGLLEALLGISSGCRIISKKDDPLLTAGECVIVLDTPDLLLIDEVFKKNLGVAVSTNPIATDYTPNNNRSFLLNNGQTIDYWWLDAVNTVIYVRINYRLLDGAVVPVSEQDFIKTTFIDSYNGLMSIGSVFENESYLSTQNVPFVADFTIEFSLDGLIYQDTPYAPLLNEKLVIEPSKISVQVEALNEPI